jgi:guanine nucleotide-binding protein G(I)/G(S)/G(T) subunit beta-1
LEKQLKRETLTEADKRKGYLRSVNAESASPLEAPHLTVIERREFSGHYNKVYAIDTTPQRELISGGIDENVIIWDMETGVKSEIIVGAVRQVTAVASSLDGNTLAFGGLTNDCCIYSRTDCERAQHTLSSHEGYITKCQYITNETLATASGDGTVKLWDVHSGRELSTFLGHGKHVTSMDINRERGVFVSSSYDGVVKLWDPREKMPDGDGRESSSKPVKVSTAAAAAVDDDAKEPEASRERRGTLIGHTGEVSAVRWFPTGDAFATGGDDGCVRLWDLRTRRPLNEYRLPDSRPRAERDLNPSQVHAIDFLHSGKAMYVGYDAESRMVSFDTVTCELIQEIPHKYDVSDVKVDREGYAVLSACWDFNVRLFA